MTFTGIKIQRKIQKRVTLLSVTLGKFRAKLFRLKKPLNVLLEDSLGFSFLYIQGFFSLVFSLKPLKK
jgi:hypothetical protein